MRCGDDDDEVNVSFVLKTHYILGERKKNAMMRAQMWRRSITFIEFLRVSICGFSFFDLFINKIIFNPLNYSKMNIQKSICFSLFRMKVNVFRDYECIYITEVKYVFLRIKFIFIHKSTKHTFTCIILRIKVLIVYLCVYCSRTSSSMNK